MLNIYKISGLLPQGIGKYTISKNFEDSQKSGLAYWCKNIYTVNIW